jgi:hypothetical protein
MGKAHRGMGVQIDGSFLLVIIFPDYQVLIA